MRTLVKRHLRISCACNIFTILFSGEPSSKDFDITLMICLLRNLIPIAIIDGLPSATDTSLRADLSRIKFYRNIIVHCDSALVADTDFESYWKDVTPVIHNYFHFLSWPEPKAHMSFSHHLVSCVCRLSSINLSFHILIFLRTTGHNHTKVSCQSLITRHVLHMVIFT